MSLTKAEILGAPRRTLKVLTPEWPKGKDGKEACIYVRSLSGAERERTTKDKDETDKDYLSRLIAMLICDEAGTPVFTVEDGPALLEGPEFTPIDRAIDMGLTFNARTEDAKEVLAGNSEATLSDGSGSE